MYTLDSARAIDGFTVISWKNLNHPAILDLAVENDVTFYDACYMTASATLKTPLVTEDEKLKRVAAKHTRVLSWKEF